MSTRKYKLAIIASHIIQYAVPLYKKINAHPEIDLTVYFCSRQGLVSEVEDPGFGIRYEWDTINLEGLNYKFLENYSPRPNPSYFFGLINPSIISELRRTKFDAILVGGYSLATFWLVFFASCFTQTPLILTGEPPTPWKSKMRILAMGSLKKIFMPQLLKRTSAILYIGKKSKEFYLSYNRAIQDKLFFCPYSVDNEYYFQKSQEFQGKRDLIKKELGIPLEYPVILFLAKLIKWKRPLVLLEAFRQLRSPAALVYVGSGQRMEILKKYVERYHLQGVHFFGFQNYGQVPKFYAIADIFVLPSMGESWGLVINEAMCFGLPILTTDKVMSAYDLVRDNVNGYIIKSTDTDGLVSALENLVGHPEVRERMGRASLEMIKDWDYQHYLKGLLEALRFVTER